MKEKKTQKEKKDLKNFQNIQKNKHLNKKKLKFIYAFILQWIIHRNTKNDNSHNNNCSFAFILNKRL